jgi:peptidyl-tRNA hydrolase, PTH1 family
MKFLIAGLGNIGPEYELTRHNIGFLVLDRLADKLGATFKADRFALAAEVKMAGRTIILIKPTTYMNLSGKAIRAWLGTEHLKPEQLLVITDDLALPYGKLRLRAKGSAGGHNGLKNIQLILETDLYARLRFGIGDTFSKGRQVDYVLGNFSAAEMTDITAHIDRAVEMILSFVTIGLENTMSKYNQ